MGLVIGAAARVASATRIAAAVAVSPAPEAPLSVSKAVSDAVTPPCVPRYHPARMSQLVAAAVEIVTLAVKSWTMPRHDLRLLDQK